MNAFKAILKREIKAYFSTPVAYVFLVIFLVLCNYAAFVTEDFFATRQADMRAFFVNMPFLLVLLVPAIAMRLWSEERKSNSIEMLFTLPVTTAQAVLAKFFAAWAVVLLALLLTFPFVQTVAYLGDPDWGPIITGYLGSFLLAGVYLAIGSFFSALTRNQVIAFVLGVVACGVLLSLGNPGMMEFMSTFLPLGLIQALEQLSLQTRFESLQRGVLQLSDLAFFVILGAGWVWANIILLEERKAA